MESISASNSKNKKNATGFFIFSKEIRHKIHKACPFFSPLDISKVISEQWKGLPESERMRYREMAKSISVQPKQSLILKAPSSPPSKPDALSPIETLGICPLFDKIQYATLSSTHDYPFVQY
ncbi:HMG box family protein [Trichomonas vaginalis G3]|uniref:HMG box family protein n=1 Tax=Trichomonas vaginalis (strain ATCC PRA-98 / G3) TaxID=412133 RepID=A2FSY5_TRIV3|nr:HMG-box family [Trichomonas vaginalis G3]EAX91981.1 HMG box family protein [Trichomonas vaginalis G3]KAI5531159.1 HMG-box family [Trichomonas vaginalis G3]|eukprot:XP_001304911.1 HMG box family protein [Trichomonas vaginalis G3]